MSGSAAELLPSRLRAVSLMSRIVAAIGGHARAGTSACR